MKSTDNIIDGLSDTDVSASDVLTGGILKGKTVERGTGRRLFGVVVELVGTGRAYVTSPTGYFKLEEVIEGEHVARFTYPGFAPVEEPVIIRNGETLDLTVEFERAD